MKRCAGMLMLLAALGGCVSTGQPPWGGSSNCGSCGGGGGGASHAATVPGYQGPWGQPVAMAMPYAAAPPGEAAARDMIARSMPMDLVETAGASLPGGAPTIVPAGFAQSGPMPLPHQGPLQPVGHQTPAGPKLAGTVAAVGAITGGGMGSPFPAKRTEVRFAAPAGMKVSWYTGAPDAKGGFATNNLEAPGRYNFLQAAVYRLKISNIVNRPGLELYPTLEVVPGNGKTDAFLAHSAVPVVFTDEDFEQVAGGNYLVKVIYLPDPQFQDLASTGPDEVVSSRLEPGADPIVEAHRRGSILLVVRMGNIDLEAPNTPSMDAPSPFMGKGPMAQGPGMNGPSMPPPGLMPGMMPPGMMPPGMMPPGMMSGPGRPMMGPNGAMPMMPPMMGTPASRPGPGHQPNGPTTKAPDGPQVQLAIPTETPASVVAAGQVTNAPAIQTVVSETIVQEEPAPTAAAPKSSGKGWKWWQAGSKR